MEILAAVVILGFLVWAKGHVVAGANGSPTLQAAGSLTITASNAPAVDPSTPFASGPIGSTFLSQTQHVETPDGSVIALPYRPSAAHNGGGVAANYGDLITQSSIGSGSGISPIEMLNAPHAPVAAPAGGAARIALPTAIAGRSTLVPAHIVGPATTPPATPRKSAPTAPVVRIATATPGRTSILTANTQGPRAVSSPSKVSPPAGHIDLATFHANPAPPQATPAQKKVSTAIVTRRQVVTGSQKRTL